MRERAGKGAGWYRHHEQEKGSQVGKEPALAMTPHLQKERMGQLWGDG